MLNNMRYLVLALVFVSLAFAAPTAKVVSVVGGVHKEKKDQWVPLRVSVKVFEKDMIKTEIESNADIKLQDGSIIRIPESAKVELTNLKGGEGGPQSVITVKEGMISFNVEKQKPGEKFFLKTGTAVVSIRGTEGVVSAYPFFTGLKSGKIEVNDGSAETHTVDAGETLFARKNEGKASFVKLKLKNSGKSEFASHIRKIAANEKMSIKEFMKALNDADRQFEKEELKIKTKGNPEKGVYKTIETPADDLEKMGQGYLEKGILYGIGIGEATDEIASRTQSMGEARTQIAQTLQTQILRYKEQYVKNMADSAQRIWEEKVNAYTEKELSGASDIKNVQLFNKKSGRFRTYSLLILNPRVVQKAIQAALSDIGQDDSSVESHFEQPIEEYKKIIEQR